jgi:hypothetical protein
LIDLPIAPCVSVGSIGTVGAGPFELQVKRVIRRNQAD